METNIILIVLAIIAIGIGNIINYRKSQKNKKDTISVINKLKTYVDVENHKLSLEIDSSKHELNNKINKSHVEHKARIEELERSLRQLKHEVSPGKSY